MTNKKLLESLDKNDNVRLSLNNLVITDYELKIKLRNVEPSTDYYIPSPNGIYEFDLRLIDKIYIRGILAKSIVIQYHSYEFAFIDTEFNSNFYGINFFSFLGKYVNFLEDRSIAEVVYSIIVLIQYNKIVVLYDTFKDLEKVIDGMLDWLTQKNFITIQDNGSVILNCNDPLQLQSILQDLVTNVYSYILNFWPKDEDIDRRDKVTVDFLINLFTRIRKISKDDLMESTHLSNKIILDWILQIDPETPIELEGNFILIKDEPSTNQLILKAINQLVQISNELIS